MSELFPQITELGTKVDQVQFFLFLTMAIWFVLCNGALVFFMFRYKRKGHDDKTAPIKGDHILEILWTMIPTVMCGIIFFFGINVWTEMRSIPEDDEAYVIEVTGQKWSWSFRYPDGHTEGTDMYVPQGRKVKLRMSSQDVIHSFFIPEFRVKEDVVPGFFTYIWFNADKAGTYNIFCTEYCGEDHSAMLGKVHVLDPETWLRYENNEPLDPNKKILTPEEEGEELYVKRACNGCHSKDGTAGIGPTFKGLMGRVETLNDGSRVTVDDNYIRQSINKPDSQIVKGYEPKKMPSFEGQLTEKQLSSIIEFLKTLN
jgi:cytochrome c oxidase subunit 2